MAHISQVEFNYIRELLGPASVGKTKFATYAQQADNQTIRHLFQQMSQGCEQKYSTLVSFLEG